MFIYQGKFVKNEGMGFGQFYSLMQ